MADETQTADSTTGNITVSGNEDAVKKLAFERDSARGETAKLKKQLDELQKNMPTEEQRAKWQEMEAAAAKAEEDRQRKAGEFDELRRQIVERHDGQIKAKDKALAEKQAERDAIDAELNNTLIGLQFAGAASLFGPNGKTVLLPEVAQSYLGNRVAIQRDEKTGARQVVVKDAHGQVILDPKSGQPMEFGKAMEEVIDAHPAKQALLRGSGKSGSNSPGGGNGLESKDLNNLRPSDFADPKVREAVRRQQSSAGALQIGPAWDKLAAGRK